MSTCPLNFDKTSGLVPVVVQDYLSKEILMQAYINREAWDESIKNSRGVYFSRSRQKLWAKGESSGNIQILKEVRVDCDNDSVLFIVEQKGRAACHTGHKSCYYRKWDKDQLVEISQALFDPKEVYP